jgi:hypothetical protein
MKPTRRPRTSTTLAAAFFCAALAGLHANASAQPGSASPSSAPVSSPRPGDISSTARALQAFDAAAAYERGDKIPTEVRDLLTRLKHQLRDLIERTLDDGVGPRSTPAAARARVLAALRREGVSTGGPEDDVHTFGSVVAINFTRPRGHPELLAATTTVSVHCGDDGSLYLFRRAGARWRLVLAEEANGYEDVSGAQGRFDFRVSPPDARGRFFVVTANVNPWCTSNWQALRYRVLRVADDPYRPRLLLSGEETIYLGTELEGFRLGATADAFTLRFDAGQRLDPGILIRPHVLKFRVEGERAARVAPVAFKPEDFADEWLGMKWEEAARWSDASRLAELKKWHAALNASGKGFYGSEILFVQPCAKPAGVWQVGVESYEGDGAPRVPPKVYFTVARVGGALRMRGVSDERPPGCPGESPPSGGGAR